MTTETKKLLSRSGDKPAAGVAPRRGRPPAAQAVGDMRKLILETSEHLLQSEGLQALSMREVARRAGVTHQAPYHHFPDRESIIAELVTQGFEDLTRRLAKARQPRDPIDRRATLEASAKAYVGSEIVRSSTE